MQYRDKTRRLTLSAILVTLAMIFSYIEFLIPISIGIPGIKLGFANLVIVIALYCLDARYAFAINIVRIILNGLMFTGVFAMTYALAGGLLSLLTMCLLKKTGRFSMIGVSMAGGVAHNLGQLIIASLMVENIKMFLYFPVLLLSGLITGILIGTAAAVLYSSIPDRLFRN